MVNSGFSEKQRSILFTVDVEEFDTALEFGHAISLEEQVSVSTKGLVVTERTFRCA